jgi:hypothetical protein
VDLIAAPPELGYDVFGKKLGVAAGSVNFSILSKQTVEDGLEVTKQLDLIKQKNGIRLLGKFLFGKFIKEIGIAELFVVAFIKRHFHDLFRSNAIGEQMIFENGTQKVRFSAPPQSGNDFDKSVPLLADQFIKVKLPLYFHKHRSY